MLKTLKSLLWIVPLIVVALEVSIRLLELGMVDGRVGSLPNFVVQEQDFFCVQPGARVIQPERYGNTLYSINSYGFRGGEVGAKSSARKILFLGDSVTFGLYVDYASTYPALIEKMYEKKFPDRTPIETINLSMIAYAPEQELAVLNKIGWKLRPDMIVLQLYMNDFDPRIKSLPTTTQLIREHLFVLEAVAKPPIGRNRVISRMKEVLVLLIFLVYASRRR